VSAAPSRREALVGLAAAGLAACDGRAARSAARRPPAASGALKDVAPCPVGCAVSTERLRQPAYVDLLTRQFSQLTPEWEMKMEYIVQDDGSFRFDAPDAIAGFAQAHGMRLYGDTLAWHAQHPPAFERMDGDPAAFAQAFRNYILAVVGRYRGQAGAWDTVNEPVAEDGEGLRESLWSRNLGAEDYMVRAFDHAREADPDARLFINDYNLERLPKKRATFMRLVERLLRRGVAIGGIGSQTHIDLGLPRGAMREALGDLAGFGLPIHISELDVSIARRFGDFRSLDDRLSAQADKISEVADAFMALPRRQRYAVTVWGLRDPESWLRGMKGGDPDDRPLLFDATGAAKPAFEALLAGLAEDRPR
jgi:endo-1,4-beta-xylanase